VNYTTDRHLNWSETLDCWILKSESYFDDDIEDFIYKDKSKYDQTLYTNRQNFIQERKRTKTATFNIDGLDPDYLLSLFRRRQGTNSQPVQVDPPSDEVVEF